MKKCDGDMKLLVLVISVVFLAVIAALEIWRRLVPAQSKLTTRIEIALVILAFVGGVAALIWQAVSPSTEEKIIEAVERVIEKRTVPDEELKGAYGEIGKLKEQLARAMRRVAELERQGVKDAKGIIEELRKSGNVERLLEVLEKDRDIHKNQWIERNREIAVVAYLRGDIDIAIEAVDEILKELPDDLFALNLRGHIHKLNGQYKKAEDCYRHALKVGRNVGDEAVQAVALDNLGVIYRERGELDKAEDMHLKSLEIAKKLGLQELMACAYGNLGLIYKTRGELDKAENMHNKSLGINKKLGRLENMAIDYANLGSVYKQRGDIKKTKEYWEKALEIFKKIGMPHMVEKVEGWIRGIEK